MGLRKVAETVVEGSKPYNFRTKADAVDFADSMKQMARRCLDDGGMVPLMAAIFDAPDFTNVVRPSN